MPCNPENVGRGKLERNSLDLKIAADLCSPLSWLLQWLGAGANKPYQHQGAGCATTRVPGPLPAVAQSSQSLHKTCGNPKRTAQAGLPGLSPTSPHVQHLPQPCSRLSPRPMAGRSLLQTPGCIFPPTLGQAPQSAVPTGTA